MNLRGKSKQTVYRLLIGTLISIFALQAQAACTFFDAFQDNKDGTVTDPRSGLIWKRCAEGFEWKGSACVGGANPFNWFDAMKIAKRSKFQDQSDWRLPTKMEMEQVVGKREDCLGGSGQAASSKISHSMGKNLGHGSFWSSSPDVGRTGRAWLVSFRGGTVASFGRDDAEFMSTFTPSFFYVRLVRAGQPMGGDVALEFHQEYTQRVITQQGKSEIDKLVEKMRQVSYPAVSWKAANLLPEDASKLYSSNLLDPNEYVLVALAGLIKADQNSQPVSLPGAPSVPRDLVSRKIQIIKGEFESSAQFTARQSAADAAAQAEFDRDQRAFEAVKRDYAAAVKQQADTQARTLAESNDPEKNKALAAKHLPQAVALALGNPVLSDISYDADKQVFNATLKSSRGTFSQQVTLPASQAVAPKLKQDLLSQKIAPIVTLQLPSLAATLVLQENSALRTERFEQANHSVKMLLELIAEYPNSAEANAARKRIPVVQREAYDAAVRSNSTSAYQSFIGDFAGADTQKLLPQAEKAKQVAAQREEREIQAKVAQERREQADRDEQYRRDAPARQARQTCEAQKQSCLASCPSYNDNARVGTGANNHHFQCNSRCNQISC